MEDQPAKAKPICLNQLRAYMSGLAIVLLVTTYAACGGSSENRGQLTLFTAQQVYDLPPEDAQRSCAVRIRGIVTYINQRNKTLVIQDSTAALLVDATQTTTTWVKPGEAVEVEGFSRRGKDFNTVVGSNLIDLGMSKMPDPRTMSFKALTASANQAYRWVEANGVVRSAEMQNDGQLILDLATNDGRLRVRIAEHRGIDFGLTHVDSKLNVTGVSRATFGARGEAIRIELLASNLDNIVVEEARPSDAFSIPVQPINSVSPNLSSETSGHRVRVDGTVTAQQPGGDLYIEDDTGALHVITAQVSSISPGRRIAALGFPGMRGSQLVLEDSVFREIDSVPAAPTAQSSFHEGLFLLKTVDQVHKLVPEEAKRGYPVRLRAIVTYYYPVRDNLFVQDSTGGIYVDCRGMKELPMVAGQLVEVEGQSAAGDFAPVVIKPTVRILGRGSLPIAPRLSLAELFSGLQDSNWVKPRIVLP
jgi:hypothetical protein